MILREPALSEHRRALAQVPTPVAAPIRGGGGQTHTLPAAGSEIGIERVADLTVNAGSHAGSESKAESKRDGLHVIETPSSKTAKSASQERDLSFEQVVAWLAVQDAATRSACAAILASEVTQIHETAKAEGFETGRKAGEATAAKEAGVQLEGLHRLLGAAEQAFADEQAQMQSLCVEIVAEALTKIAGPLLASETAVIGMVREVLARVKEGREIVVRVARDDLPLLRRHEGELSAILSGRRLELLADARVELGGCIVESRLGNLDGRLEVQLRELYETLRLAKSSQRELP